MPDLVLLPGMMCNRRLWADMADGLSSRADLHYGDLSQSRSIEKMTESVLASSPTTFHLCGFSMGGYVAREIALRAPDRVISLVLINTSGIGTDRQEHARRLDYIELIKDKPFKGLTASNLEKSVHFSRIKDHDLLERIQEMAHELGRDVFVRQLGLIRDDGHTALNRISCPSLVVVARDDRLRTLDEAQRLADGIPNAQLRIVDNSGHMTPLEQPAALTKILTDWLDNMIDDHH